MKIQYLLIAISFGIFSCANTAKKTENTSSTSTETTNEKMVESDKSGLQKAYFASGCFWCVEAIFESVIGVDEVISGYAGGTKEDATYPKVSNGITDHVEAVLVYYDDKKVSYSTLVDVFFGSQNPTTPNQQGPDRGKQYRSVAYYQNEEEKKIIEEKKNELNKTVYDGRIVTEITPFTTFFAAEEYHQDYEHKHPNNSYIRAVSIPRLNKFKAKFPHLLKDQRH